MQIVLASAWAYFAHHWYFKTFPPRPTAIIYDERRGMEKLIYAYGLNKKYDIRLTMDVAECLGNIEKLVGMKTVFLSGVHSHGRNVILNYCVANRISAFIIPRSGDILMSGASSLHMCQLPILRIDRYILQPEYLFVKRPMDIVLSLIVTVLTNPIMLITALAIYSYDKGPVLYKQISLGKDGKIFEILKFRSMRVNAEIDDIARLSTGDKDNRITPVGQFICKYRIDGLP